MQTIIELVHRNRKLFFRDKGMLLSSMITPAILIVLYATFLANLYKDSFRDAVPDMLNVSDKLLNGAVAGQLAAALLAVSAVTVTFCVNLTMIQDKAGGVIKDFNVSPVRRTKIYAGYFISTVINSLMVNFLAVAVCLIYVSRMGWYLTVQDVLWVILDVVLLVLFGSVLSSIICYPLRTQGQMSAVGTIVSGGYGFICGAYMPISSFGDGLQSALSFLPGTYGTSLLKNHLLRGVFEEMKDIGFPEDAVTGIADSLDCNPVFRGNVVSVQEMIWIMVGSTVVLGIVYLLITMIREKE